LNSLENVFGKNKKNQLVLLSSITLFLLLLGALVSGVVTSSSEV
jgi:hypothetical protein